MSDYFIIGENRKIASITDGSSVVAITRAGVTYVYWHTDAHQIMVSTSTDHKVWTTPALVWAAATNYDVYPAGVVHNGSNFILAIGEINLISGAAATYLVTSAAGISFTLLTTVAWAGEYWAAPTDLQYVSGSYYLAGTVRTVFNGPLRSSVRTSANLTSWTSLGYPSQLNATDNVWARISVNDGTVNLVEREGDFSIKSIDDRILHVSYINGAWSSTRPVVDGTGSPDIAILDVGYAVIYQDQSIEGGQGVWSWIYFDGTDFFKRGTFSQGFEYGTGGSVLSTDTGFAAVYATRTSDASTAGTLYYRAFTGTTDEPAIFYQPRNIAEKPAPDTLSLSNFSFEASYGQSWLSLSDGIRYYITPDDFGEKAQTLRRITAQSPFYDGTYLIHAVRENINETFTVVILGSSQNQVTENVMLLEEVVSQPAFQIRMTVDDHQETWSCQQADYTIQRGHLMLHNTRAMMRLSVPRLPAVSYGVI